MVFHFGQNWPNLQRGLSAIAELLVTDGFKYRNFVSNIRLMMSWMSNRIWRLGQTDMFIFLSVITEISSNIIFIIQSVNFVPNLGQQEADKNKYARIKNFLMQANDKSRATKKMKKKKMTDKKVRKFTVQKCAVNMRRQYRQTCHVSQSLPPIASSVSQRYNLRHRAHSLPEHSTLLSDSNFLTRINII